MVAREAAHIAAATAVPVCVLGNENHPRARCRRVTLPLHHPVACAGACAQFEELIESTKQEPQDVPNARWSDGGIFEALLMTNDCQQQAKIFNDLYDVVKGIVANQKCGRDCFVD